MIGQTSGKNNIRIKSIRLAFIDSNGGVMGTDAKSLNELVAIKKLLIAQLLASGISAKTVGELLGMTQQRVSQIAPVSKIVKEAKRNG